MIEKVEWNPLCEWVYIVNKYGKMLTFDAPIFYNAKSILEYQPNISEKLESGNYDTFLDVGAFHGYFSVIASNFCKVVKTYEANPFYFGIVLDNMKCLFNVECNYAFVGSEASKPCAPTSHDHLVVYRGVDKYNVPVVKLDDELQVVSEKVLIKLDVEGNEIDVLKGAKELCKNPNVHWCIDVHTQYDHVSHEIIRSFFDEKRNIIVFDKYMEVL